VTAKRQASIERRVHSAAEAALARQNFVSPLDVLVGAGFVTQKQVSDWRFGRIPYLERVATGGLGTLSRAMAVFRNWAIHRGLKPSWTAYHGWGHARRIPLQFSKSGHATIERIYSTHFIRAAENIPSGTRRVTGADGNVVL
jgi:hypothetical protein